MRKLVFVALVSVFAIGVGVNSAKAIDKVVDPPACDYDKCPGGSDKCCLQGGVQLFINL